MKNAILLFAVSICFLFDLQSQTMKEIQDRIPLVKQFLSEQKELHGHFMIGGNDEVMLQQGLGYANRETHTPFSATTLSTIGSITKPLTATGIMILIEKGMIKTDDPLTRFFKNVPEDKKAITVHQLLTHSAGFPGAIGDDYASVDADAFQALVWKEELLFPPGTGYEYSNVDYSLLGMIIEKISGMTYSAFLEKYIFKPAGMQTAGYHNTTADYTRLAQGYTREGKRWGTTKEKNWQGNEPYWHLKANGGMLVSSEDMFHWYLALKHNTILSEKTQTLQLKPYVREGEHGDTYYSYGFVVDTEGNCVQHNGGNGIFKADFRWFPHLDIFLYAFTNDAASRLFYYNDIILEILMTGHIPEDRQKNWVTINLNSFPGNDDQKIASQFLQAIQQSGSDDGALVLAEIFSTGIVERNGEEKLHNIIAMLHSDIGNKPLQSVKTSGSDLQLVFDAEEKGAFLKIQLTMLAHRIDKLSVAIENNN